VVNRVPSPASASDEIERRLAAAAQAVREQDLCRQQRSRLSAREQTTAAELETARQEYVGAEKDVGRLEHLSLTRVLSALHGSREDTLAREKAQAEAARYRVAEAQHRLEAVQAELGRLESRQAELSGAGRAYTDALAAVHDRLGTAAGWSTFDTYLDHSMVANAVKHDRIDQAAQAARAADQLLARLRSDLSDLGRLEPTAPTLEIGAGFRFADVFFNNIFTDLAVGQQIRDAQGNVDRSVQQVRTLQDRLTEQVAAVSGQLGAIDAERDQLLAQ
jgi:chromosome segregation ATPase